MKPDRREPDTAEPVPPPVAHGEDLLNRNVGRRYDTPRRYDTKEQPARRAEDQGRSARD